MFALFGVADEDALAGSAHKANRNALHVALARWSWAIHFTSAFGLHANSSVSSSDVHLCSFAC